MRFKYGTPHEKRLDMFAKQKGLCWLCNEPLDLFLPAYAYGSCSWEHIVPRSGGGSKGWRNVAITHWECNKARGDRFIWKLQRPRQHSWNSEARLLNPARAQKYFDVCLNRLCRILRRTAETEGASR